MTYVYYGLREDELYHHGIKNQKWGIRRFQNPDGTLTPEGRIRYGRVKATMNDASVKAKAYIKRKADAIRESNEKKWIKKAEEAAERVADAADMQNRINDPDYKRRQRLLSKDPKYLTDAELKELNARKDLEDQYKKKYAEAESAGKSLVKELGRAMFDEVVKPSSIAIGKAIVLDAFSKPGKDAKEFESIATEQLRSAFGYKTEKNKDKNKNNGGKQNNNQNQGNNNNNNQNNQQSNKSKKKQNNGKKQSAWEKFMAPTPMQVT